MSTVKRWLHRDAKDLAAHEREHLDEALAESKVLATIYSMRQELSALWARSTASKEQLLHAARRLVPSRRGVGYRCAARFLAHADAVTRACVTA